MKIFRFLFLLILLPTIGISHDAPTSPCGPIASCRQEKVLEIIQYARAYRKDTTLSGEEEKFRQKAILELAIAGLPKYDSERSLEDAVRRFAKDELLLTVGVHTIIDASLTDIGGKSDDPVFLAYDEAGNLCYVVKAFRNPSDLSSKFLPEISALDLIDQLALPGVAPVRPIAFAVYSQENDEWGLLLETAAKGQRLDQYVYQLGALQPASKERLDFLAVCQNAFRKLGEGFAKLHARKSTRPNYLPQQDLEKYDQKLSQILDSPFIKDALQKRFPIDQFVRYTENIKARASHFPIYYSYWHGDAHMGNMFYDQQKEAIYFIDVAKMHQSISIQGEPLLSGTMDLIRVEENLRRKAIGHLREDELQSLVHTFYNAYEQSSGERIEGPVLLFDRTSKKLGRLIEYSRYVHQTDPIKRSSEQAVFESSLDYFSNQIYDELQSRNFPKHK